MPSRRSALPMRICRPSGICARTDSIHCRIFCRPSAPLPMRKATVALGRPGPTGELSYSTVTPSGAGWAVFAGVLVPCAAGAAPVTAWPCTSSSMSDESSARILNSSRAVRRMISRIWSKYARSCPGTSTTMVSPRAVMEVSRTASSSTRLEIVWIACRTAFSSSWVISSCLRARATSLPLPDTRRSARRVSTSSLSFEASPAWVKRTRISRLLPPARTDTRCARRLPSSGVRRPVPR